MPNMIQCTICSTRADNLSRASVFCVECNASLCDTHDIRAHSSAGDQVPNHSRQLIVNVLEQPLAGANGTLCELCDELPSDVHCRQCDADYCTGCDSDIHKPMKMQSHQRKTTDTARVVGALQTTADAPQVEIKEQQRGERYPLFSWRPTRNREHEISFELKLLGFGFKWSVMCSW